MSKKTDVFKNGEKWLLVAFSMSVRQEEPKEDHQGVLEDESAGSRAIDMESETEETVRFSLGIMVGRP